MGGFKKSNKSSSDASQDQTNRPKSSFSAFSKSQETSFNNALEDQFKQAFDLKRNSRGCGLGYDANLDPENKTFFIDKQSKSKKF
jgi:hypothetical protein